MTQLQYGRLNENGEYEGLYEGCRKMCRDCIHSEHENHQHKGSKCNKLNLHIHPLNDICRQFNPSIKNPSYKRKFNYDEYFEWFMNDYHRPYGIIEDQIIGSAKLGFVTLDNGKLARQFPKIYSPFYKTRDKLRCVIHTPNCYVYINKYIFYIDYRKFKDWSFLDDGYIDYKVWSYKEKETSRKWTSHYNGKFEINKFM